MDHGAVATMPRSLFQVMADRMHYPLSKVVHCQVLELVIKVEKEKKQWEALFPF